MELLEVSPEWLVTMVNEFAPEPRLAARRISWEYADISEGMPESARSVGLDDLPHVAGRVWQVFGGETPAARAAALNGLLADARPTPWIDAGAVERWTSTSTSPAALLSAGCGLILLRVVRGDGWTRLGVCAGADCADAHLDRPGRRRRYCSRTCLNRARVRAHRARHGG